jgi:hypothetical protein
VEVGFGVKETSFSLNSKNPVYSFQVDKQFLFWHLLLTFNLEELPYFLKFCPIFIVPTLCQFTQKIFEAQSFYSKIKLILYPQVRDSFLFSTLFAWNPIAWVFFCHSSVNFTHNGNTGCGVLKGGIQNYKDFWLKINCSQKLGIILENKVI